MLRTEQDVIDAVAAETGERTEQLGHYLFDAPHLTDVIIRFLASTVDIRTCDEAARFGIYQLFAHATEKSKYLTLLCDWVCLEQDEIARNYLFNIVGGCISSTSEAATALSLLPIDKVGPNSEILVLRLIAYLPSIAIPRLTAFFTHPAISFNAMRKLKSLDHPVVNEWFLMTARCSKNKLIRQTASRLAKTEATPSQTATGDACLILPLAALNVSNCEVSFECDLEQLDQLIEDLVTERFGAPTFGGEDLQGLLLKQLTVGESWTIVPCRAPWNLALRMSNDIVIGCVLPESPRQS
ncbi:hypothetical protein F183_A44810 [Bryobacterales bacterium F-183]|nr:hypothetical protein F183_A44810 [Bryobacterales bacterium F-183]